MIRRPTNDKLSHQLFPDTALVRSLVINLMSQCVKDKLQSSDGQDRRPMVLFALDSGLSPVGTPPPTSMSTIYLSPSNLGSSTDDIASRGGRMTLRAIGGLNALLYVDLSRREIGRASWRERVWQ